MTPHRAWSQFLIVTGPLLLSLAVGVLSVWGKERPEWLVFGAVFATLFGLTFFLRSKLSVVRTGKLISFGSRRMGPRFQAQYRWGYTALVLGVAFVLALASQI